jgi:hypothetical protein
MYMLLHLFHKLYAESTKKKHFSIQNTKNRHSMPMVRVIKFMILSTTTMENIKERLVVVFSAKHNIFFFSISLLFSFVQWSVNNLFGRFRTMPLSIKHLIECMQETGVKFPILSIFKEFLEIIFVLKL